MSLLLVFLDGVGIGPDDPATNPFSRFRMKNIDAMMSLSSAEPADGRVRTDGHVFSTIDANLDVEGLPQSGTGQASLFTGINCARIVGRHFGPFPHSSTRPVLAEHNVFSRVDGLPDSSSAFANAYPPRFFEVMRMRDRWTVTTRCCLDAGVRIRNLDDLRAGNALAADVTGERLEAAGFGVRSVTEDRAAGTLVDLASRHRLTVFEYFMTDKVGHSQSFRDAYTVIKSLDRFLGHLVSELEETGTTLLVTSDHGNLEDLSLKTHTRNPVPFVALGNAAPDFADVRSILDVTPAILQSLGEAG